jgi:hypothetical protein
MVGTELEGRFTIRFAIGSAATQLRHVRAAWGLFQAQADGVLARHAAGAGAAAQQQQQ